MVTDGNARSSQLSDGDRPPAVTGPPGPDQGATKGIDMSAKRTRASLPLGTTFGSVIAGDPAPDAQCRGMAGWPRSGGAAAASWAGKEPPAPAVAEKKPAHRATWAPASEAIVQHLSAFNRGNALMEQYRYAEAAAQFEKVVQAFPDWTAARFNLGLARLNSEGAAKEGGRGAGKQNLNEAREAFESVLAADPDHLPAKFMLGLYYQHDGQDEKSLELFQAVHERDPDDPYVTYKLAESLLAVGRNEEGAADAGAGRDARPGVRVRVVSPRPVLPTDTEDRPGETTARTVQKAQCCRTGGWLLRRSKRRTERLASTIRCWVPTICRSASLRPRRCGLSFVPIHNRSTRAPGMGCPRRQSDLAGPGRRGCRWRRRLGRLPDGGGAERKHRASG